VVVPIPTLPKVVRDVPVALRISRVAVALPNVGVVIVGLVKVALINVGVVARTTPPVPVELVAPVPPFPTGSVPVTIEDEARLIAP
jgi:hypothetical protein